MGLKINVEEETSFGRNKRRRGEKAATAGFGPSVKDGSIHIRMLKTLRMKPTVNAPVSPIKILWCLSGFPKTL